MLNWKETNKKTEDSEWEEKRYGYSPFATGCARKEERGSERVNTVVAAVAVYHHKNAFFMQTMGKQLLHAMHQDAVSET